MSRRHSAEKRQVLPDPKFKDIIVSKFMNQIMRDGKKSVAERIVYGAFDLVEGQFPMDFSLAGVAAALIYAGVVARSRSLLVTGVLAMLGFLGYFTNEYFADMLSWPVALILMGLLMLGLSSYALKLGRRMG